MFECISHSLEFLFSFRSLVGTFIVFNGFVPSLFHHLHETRVGDPIRFKPEKFAFWDGRLNDHNTGGVIRDGFPQRVYQSIWKRERPVQCGEKPVELFQKWLKLHVGPSICSPFDWKFSKVLFTYEIIKGEHILHTASRRVAIVR